MKVRAKTEEEREAEEETRVALPRVRRCGRSATSDARAERPRLRKSYADAPANERTRTVMKEGVDWLRFPFQ